MATQTTIHEAFGSPKTLSPSIYRYFDDDIPPGCAIPHAKLRFSYHFTPIT